MLFSVLVIIVSTALFVYWFRYVCELILNMRAAETEGQWDDASLDSLASPEALSGATIQDLDSVSAKLDRQYEKVTFLLKRTPATREDSSAIEDLLLHADYQVMRAAYPLARRVSNRAARAALAEMIQVVKCFARTARSRQVFGNL